jgi:hypothetical protein
VSALTGSLALGRQMAEGRMTETVTAATYTETVGTDLQPDRAPIAQHYDGKAQVGFPSSSVRTGDAASQQFGAVTPVVKVPVDAPPIPVGAVFTVTASTIDTGLVAREFRVTGRPQSGQVTARRYPVEEI